MKIGEYTARVQFDKPGQHHVSWDLDMGLVAVRDPDEDVEIYDIERACGVGEE